MVVVVPYSVYHSIATPRPSLTTKSALAPAASAWVSRSAAETASLRRTTTALPLTSRPR